MENGSFCERVQNFKMAKKKIKILLNIIHGLKRIHHHDFHSNNIHQSYDFDYYNSYVTPEALNGNPYTMVSNVYIVSEF